MNLRPWQAGSSPRALPWRLLVGAAAVGLSLITVAAVAQEAPPPEPVIAITDPGRPSTSAEASYQDLEAGKARNRQMDEAIFTEISPLTVPETAIRLPDDQEQ